MSESQICDPNGNPIEQQDALEENLMEPEEAPVQQESPSPEEPEKDVLHLPELTAGLIVGVQPNGEFIFETIGTDVTLTQVLGLHKYADHRINTMVGLQSGGPAVVVAKLERVDQMLQVVLNMLTQEQKSRLLK